MRLGLRGRPDGDGQCGTEDTISLVRQLGVLRTLLLGVEILTGRVKLPKGALGTRSPGAVTG
jgi:hypothetical protein